MREGRRRRREERRVAGLAGRLRLAVVIPVYGQHHLTALVLDDLRRQRDAPPCDVYLVDNGGDWSDPEPDHPVRPRVLVPGTNLGWTRGTNLGLRAAAEVGYDGYVCLNNDTRLDPRHLQGLAEALAAHPGAGLIAPLYDDVYPQQKGPYQGPAAGYVRPHRPAEAEARFVDGTCLLIPAATLARVGYLDEEHFGAYGWGADLDYCFRAAATGRPVLVTERAYLNHVHQGTARTLDAQWDVGAEAEMGAGMTAKYGPGWRVGILGDDQLPPP